MLVDCVARVNGCRVVSNVSASPGPYTPTAVTASTGEVGSPCATRLEISEHSCFGVTGPRTSVVVHGVALQRIEADLRVGAPCTPTAACRNSGGSRARYRGPMTTLRVGGLNVPYEQAQNWVTDYLVNHPGGSGYPAYDTYEGAGKERIDVVQADLLAIALLNVSRNPIPTYYALEALIPKLNKHLEGVEFDLPLEEASPDTLDAVAKLFSVLDPKRPKWVKMTKVAKVLARKRPGLIPIYDKYVSYCYTDCADAPVPPVKGRSWEAYSRSWLQAVQKDLTDQLDHWQALAAIAPGEKISALRALDIVAWRAGQQGFRKDAAVESDS
jgi:hypothetical protein